MKAKVFLLFLILLFFLSSCNNYKNLLKENELNCSTFIEGKFIAPKTYDGIAPIVLLNKGNEKDFYRGEVINKNDQGIYLLKKSYSFVDDPDTMFIEYKQIRAIVDETKLCIYGDLNDKESVKTSIKFYLEREDDPDYQPIFLALNSNQHFNYCIKPGKYKLLKIIKEVSTDYYYESFPIFECEIEILENKVNYIGDIELLKNLESTDDKISIPFYKQVKSQNASAAFGLLGGIISELSNNSWQDEIRGFYDIIVHEPKSISKTNIEQMNICPLKINIIK
jgi:hypothetical protein